MKVTGAMYSLESKKHGRFTVEFYTRDCGKAAVDVFSRSSDGTRWTQKTPGNAQGYFRPTKTAALYWARLLAKGMA